jgi:hypothetical protein
MAQAVSRRPLISKDRVQTQTTLCRIYCGKAYWVRVVIEYFGFSLCVSFHHFSLLTFHSFTIDTTQAKQVAASLNKTPYSFSLSVDYKDKVMYITTYCRNNTKHRKIQAHSVSNTHSLLATAGGTLCCRGLKCVSCSI